MAKLIVRSEKTEAEIEIIETEEGYGGTCSGAPETDQHAAAAHEAKKVVSHHRFEDAIAYAEIHMSVYHDDKEPDA